MRLAFRGIISIRLENGDFTNLSPALGYMIDFPIINSQCYSSGTSNPFCIHFYSASVVTCKTSSFASVLYIKKSFYCVMFEALSYRCIIKDF
jgi:hypothetical protein